MIPTQISDFLRTEVGLFQHLSDDRLADLVQGSRVVSYEPNEAVVEFGEEASFLGVLLEGELSASVVADGGQRQVVGHVKAGDTFGEMALMADRTFFLTQAGLRKSPAVLADKAEHIIAILGREPGGQEHWQGFAIDRG